MTCRKARNIESRNLIENHSQVQKSIVSSKIKQFSQWQGGSHAPGLSLTHTNTHTHTRPWHWIVMSDTKSTAVKCNIFPHNTGEIKKPLNKACKFTDTQLSGPDSIMKGTVFITHSNCRFVRFVGQVRCEDRCWTSWRLVNYITEMCLDNTSKTMTGVIKFHTQSDCTTAMAHLNMLCQHWLVTVPRTDDLFLQLSLRTLPV